MGNKGAKKVSLDAEFVDKLKKIFERFDLDSSNSIEREEILVLFKRYPEDSADLVQLFGQMDDYGRQSISM